VERCEITRSLPRCRDSKPELGASALELLRSPQPPLLESILTLLLNDIAAFGHDFAFVFDDYHAIETQAIHDSVQFVLDHLPPGAHLILTRRVDPPLALARLRARTVDRASRRRSVFHTRRR